MVHPMYGADAGSSCGGSPHTNEQRTRFDTDTQSINGIALETSGLAEFVGQRITFWRNKRGMSVADLSRLTRASHTNVSKWEKGFCMPSLANLIRLCRALDLAYSDLLPTVR